MLIFYWTWPTYLTTSSGSVVSWVQRQNLSKSCKRKSVKIIRFICHIPSAFNRKSYLFPHTCCSFWAFTYRNSSFWHVAWCLWKGVKVKPWSFLPFCDSSKQNYGFHPVVHGLCHEQCVKTEATRLGLRLTFLNLFWTFLFHSSTHIEMFSAMINTKTGIWKKKSHCFLLNASVFLQNKRFNLKIFN